MADDTNARRQARDAANARAGRASETNERVLGDAGASTSGFGGKGRQGSPSDAEPDYTGMGMVERGAARRKWLQSKEEADKKKAEQAAVRGMK